MNWLYESFKPYCERNGVYLLTDDMRYIDKILRGMPVWLQKQIANDYCNIWIKALTEAPCASMRQNFARKQANMYLIKIYDTGFK